MRSIGLYFIDVSQGDLESCLSAIARQNGEGCWVCSSPPEEHALYLTVLTDPRNIGEDQLTSLRKKFGRAPDIWFLADISGRIPGDTEVHRLTEHMLSRFDGVALDDFTDHCWTLQEIRDGSLVEGHPFFDYQGWYQHLKGM